MVEILACSRDVCAGPRPGRRLVFCGGSHRAPASSLLLPGGRAQEARPGGGQGISVGRGITGRCWSGRQAAQDGRGDFAPEFPLEWALKDVDLAIAAAGARTLPVLAALSRQWRAAVGAGHGREDVSAVRLAWGRHMRRGGRKGPGRS